MALQRIDNVGIVVESLDAAIAFFAELGLELEGRAMIEGDCQGVSPGRISRLPNAANCERESQISLTRRFPSERNATE